MMRPPTEAASGLLSLSIPAMVGRCEIWGGSHQCAPLHAPPSRWSLWQRQCRPPSGRPEALAARWAVPTNRFPANGGRSRLRNRDRESLSRAPRQRDRQIPVVKELLELGLGRVCPRQLSTGTEQVEIQRWGQSPGLVLAEAWALTGLRPELSITSLSALTGTVSSLGTAGAKRSRRPAPTEEKRGLSKLGQWDQRIRTEGSELGQYPLGEKNILRT